MPSDYPPDRRQFTRITFDGPVSLQQNGRHWQVKLIDLSLKGLLVETPAHWQADIPQPFQATISLGEDICIEMALHWRHSEGGHSGFECRHIDIDSITHLRRLVELNVGDVGLLEREVAALGR